MQWFRGTPTEAGWYFLADEQLGWKAAQPVPVRKVEYADGGVEFQVRQAACGTGVWDSVAKFRDFLWFGPIRVPEPSAVWFENGRGVAKPDATVGIKDGRIEVRSPSAAT